MRRTLARVAGLAAVALAAVAPLHGVNAQAIPNITAAKSAASNAAAATNRHTEAVSGAAVTREVSPAPKPAAKKPIDNPFAPAPTGASAGKPKGKSVSKAAAKPASKPASKPADKPAAAAPAKPVVEAVPAPDQARTAPPAARRDSAKSSSSTSVATRGAAGEMTFLREVYSYPGTTRRDPFLSLLKSGDLRPLLSDLKLVTVLYDPTGRNSVAIMRDLSTKDQYRVKVGQQIGRMRVIQIQPRQLVFTIEEFGYSRQEILALTDTTTARTR